MKVTNVSINLYCKWRNEPPVYRIFIDSELLGERTYIWDNNTHYIQEIISLTLDSGPHVLSIKPVDAKDSTFLIVVESNNHQNLSIIVDG